MKRLSMLALTVCILLAAGTKACLPEAQQFLAEEAQMKLRGAASVEWAGGSYALVKEKVIHLPTGKTVLEDIQKISAWNGVTLAFSTAGAWYQLDEDGEIRKFNPADTENHAYEISAAADYLFCVDGCYDHPEDAKMFVYDLKNEEVLIEEEIISYRSGFFLFEGSGEKRIVSTTGKIYTEDGLAITDHVYTTLCGNANGGYVTNGVLTGYNADTKESLVISLPSGRTVCTFPGRWALYEGNCHQIFTDHTALIASDPDHSVSDLLVSLDGSVILQLDHGDHFLDRGSHEFYQYKSDGDDYCYDVSSNESWKVLTYRSWNDEAVRLYQSLQSGQISVRPVSDRDPDPEWTEKHPPISPPYAVFSCKTAEEGSEQERWKYGVVSPDGELLANRLWDDVSVYFGYDIQEDHVWGGQDTLIVYDRETGCGVLDRRGNMVLPPIFDTQDGKYCIHSCGEHGFAARKDGEWHFFRKDGQLQY